MIGFLTNKLTVIYHDSDAAQKKDWRAKQKICARKVKIATRIVTPLREAPSILFIEANSGSK
jgi:hypothetical protein